MRVKKNIPEDELLRLKQKRWSHQRLAIYFNVSKMTIKRRLWKIAGKKDPAVMNFAKLLEEVGRDAPPGYCRDEVMRLVNNIRTYHARPEEAKKKQVIISIETGAHELEHIAEDCSFSDSETKRILRLLINEKKVRVLKKLCKQQE